MNKKLILGAMFGLIFAVIGGWALTQSVNVGQAVSTGSQWSGWSDIEPGCVATQCDSSAGTTSQMRTCLLGGGSETCVPEHTTASICNKVCPKVIFTANYRSSSFGPIEVAYRKIGNLCIRPFALSLDVPVWAYYQYTQQVPITKNLENVCTGGELVLADTQTQAGVSCTATVTSCDPDSYWCLPAEGEGVFTRVSVTSTQATGFKWLEGMDGSCKFPEAGTCNTTCGYKGGDKVADGTGGLKPCEATPDCVIVDWCQKTGDNSFSKVSITEDERNLLTGKPWVTGMDVDCNITCHRNMEDGTCSQSQQAICGETEIVGACDCKADTEPNVFEATSSTSAYMTCHINEEVPGAEACPTTCGYVGGTVHDGNGGQTSCAAVTCGSGSGGGSNGGGLLTHGFYAPEKFVFLINGGATTTDNRAVKLTIDGGADATKMALSNTEDFTTASQQAYATSADWTLASGKGDKKVYIKFYNVYGEKSEVVSSTIALTKDEVVANEPIVPQVLGVSVYNFTRNLSVGSRGEEVKALQQFLIDVNTGTNARSLAKIGATGYFGPYTKMALAEYQKSVGIFAGGYFGPITRAYVNNLNQ